MRYQSIIRSSLFSLALLGFTLPASASILTFDIVDPGEYPVSEDFPEGFGIDQVYGDDISGPSQMVGTATYSYGNGGEGYTPHVQVSYDPGSVFTGGPSLWRYDYGDLDRVLYQGSVFTGIGNNYDFLQIVLFADPDYEVQLYGFDLGGWLSDYTIDGVAVYDNYYNGFFPALNRVVNDTNVVVPGMGHLSYAFGTPIQSNVVTIMILANNLGDDSQYIGIDNIRFGEEFVEGSFIPPLVEVPEPGTLSMFSAALVGLGCVTLRKKYRRA